MHNYTPHHLTAVTPSDSETLTGRGLWINVGGDISLVLSSGDTPVTLAVPGGIHLPYPLLAGKVRATGTTATGIFIVTS